MSVHSPMRTLSAVAGPLRPQKAPQPPEDAGTARAGRSNLPFDADFSRTSKAFGGIAARRRLHAIHPASPGDEAAALGFALTALAHLAGPAETHQPILWILHRAQVRECGRPYGPGLAAFGLPPGRIVLFAARTFEDVLVAAEMGLELGALAGVLMELPPQIPDGMLALGKRLALRAERSATPAFLLHAGTAAPPSPVATRWQIASLPAEVSAPWSPPEPRAALTLVKNRFGPTGRWSLPLVSPPSTPRFRGCDAVSSCVPPPHSEPVVPASVDGPDPPSRNPHAI